MISKCWSMFGDIEILYDTAKIHRILCARWKIAYCLLFNEVQAIVIKQQAFRILHKYQKTIMCSLIISVLFSVLVYSLYIPTSACVIQTICLFLRYLVWTWLVSWFGSPFTSLHKYYSNVISLNLFDRSVHSSNVLYVY